MNYDEIEQLSETEIIEAYNDLFYINEYISGCDCCNVQNCYGNNVLRHIWRCSGGSGSTFYGCKLYETSSRNFAIVDGISTSVDISKGYNSGCDDACRNLDFSYGRWSSSV